jgi:hypothetical protein
LGGVKRRKKTNKFNQIKNLKFNLKLSPNLILEKIYPNAIVLRAPTNKPL